MWLHAQPFTISTLIFSTWQQLTEYNRSFVTCFDDDYDDDDDEHIWNAPINSYIFWSIRLCLDEKRKNGTESNVIFLITSSHYIITVNSLRFVRYHSKFESDVECQMRGDVDVKCGICTRPELVLADCWEWMWVCCVRLCVCVLSC